MIYPTVSRYLFSLDSLHSFSLKPLLYLLAHIFSWTYAPLAHPLRFCFFLGVCALASIRGGEGLNYAALTAQEVQIPEARETDLGGGDESSTKELKRSFIDIELGQTVKQFRQHISRQENGENGRKGGKQDNGQETESSDDPESESYYYFLYDLYTSEIAARDRNETLIEVQGNGFVEKGLFQFAAYNDKEGAEPQLVAITIFLNPRWSSYEQIFEKLTADYDLPERLNPRHSIWQNERTIVTLEKQLRYKIIDKEYLEELKAQDQESFDLYQYNYAEFLKKF